MLQGKSLVNNGIVPEEVGDFDSYGGLIKKDSGYEWARFLH